MNSFVRPEWPAPPNVRACSTLREGGHECGKYAGFNLADHVGDDPLAVAENRALLRRLLPDLPAEPNWLNQVHGTRCVSLETSVAGVTADAAVSRNSKGVCAILSADCLPLLLCDQYGTVVAAAHAGWRGLADGVVETTVAAMDEASKGLLAWLGPAIGPTAFEVGAEVRAEFLARDPAAGTAFVPVGDDKWLADLYALARQRLNQSGVTRIYGGGECTYRNPQRYFSYRRDGHTGRMATLIWISKERARV